jgi:hypothetical protein
MAAIGGGGSVVTLKLEYTDGEIRRVSFPMPTPAAIAAAQSYVTVYASLLAHLQKKLGQHQVTHNEISLRYDC